MIKLIFFLLFSNLFSATYLQYIPARTPVNSDRKNVVRLVFVNQSSIADTAFGISAAKDKDGGFCYRPYSFVLPKNKTSMIYVSIDTCRIKLPDPFGYGLRYLTTAFRLASTGGAPFCKNDSSLLHTDTINNTACNSEIQVVLFCDKIRENDTIVLRDTIKGSTGVELSSQWKRVESEQASIYDASGRLIRSGIRRENAIQFARSAGIYFVRSKNYSGQIIKF